MMNIQSLMWPQHSISDFLPLLESGLHSCFGKTLPENYDRNCSWGLLHLIENNLMDCYHLIFLDDRVWTGSGGIIREFQSEKIYQGMFRGFSCASDINRGLGVPVLVHQYATKEQISRAKNAGCTKFIISFNEHNYRLYQITLKYTLPKHFDPESFYTLSEPVLFNGVKQWLIIMPI